jgi:hypothetical protein
MKIDSAGIRTTKIGNIAIRSERRRGGKTLNMKKDN